MNVEIVCGQSVVVEPEVPTLRLDPAVRAAVLAVPPPPALRTRPAPRLHPHPLLGTYICISSLTR